MPPRAPSASIDLDTLRLDDARALLSHAAQDGTPAPGEPPTAYLQRLIDGLCELSARDPLTGLANRRHFRALVDRAIETVARSGDSALLLLLDIDHFKMLNDTQGHAAGDTLLRELARRLQATLREEDTVARLGDDDFAVVVEGLGTDRERALAHAERIAAQLYAAVTAPCELGLASGPYRSTPSIGITVFAGRAEPAEGVLKQAEVALYRAKEDGRNAIRFFSETMQAMVDARAEHELLLTRGCELFQGYLFGRPVPIEEWAARAGRGG